MSQRDLWTRGEENADVVGGKEEFDSRAFIEESKYFDGHDKVNNGREGGGRKNSNYYSVFTVFFWNSISNLNRYSKS